MDRLLIGILFSGEGTRAKAICDAVSHNILNIDISFLLTDSDRNSQDFEGYNLINLPITMFQTIYLTESITKCIR